ncbi:MAG: hypothetical protein WBN97_01205 [Parvibaculum sp.]
MLAASRAWRWKKRGQATLAIFSVNQDAQRADPPDRARQHPHQFVINLGPLRFHAMRGTDAASIQAHVDGIEGAIIRGARKTLPKVAPAF